jgi:hypothetical protein
MNLLLSHAMGTTQAAPEQGAAAPPPCSPFCAMAVEIDMPRGLGFHRSVTDDNTTRRWVRRSGWLAGLVLQTLLPAACGDDSSPGTDADDGGGDPDEVGGEDGGPPPDSGAECGDHACEGGETCASCPGDCGACPTDDLCEGLVTDTAPHPMTALAKPAPGAAVTDPQFSTTIRRISDAGAAGAIVPMYSTIPAWNADESLLILYEVGRGHRLHDGRTYAFLRMLDISPPDLEQVFWHPSDPDLLLYVNGNTLVRRHVSSGVEDPLHSFSFCPDGPSGGSDVMYISWDGNVLGLTCGGEVFAYRVDTDTVGRRIAWDSETGPQAGPSGGLLYLDGHVVDFDMTILRTLDLGNPWEHASLGRYASGHDVYFGVQFDPGPGGCEVGSLVAHDLTDGSCRVIVGESTGYRYPPSGTHVSAVALQRPGWVVVGVVGDPAGAALLDSELLLADTNPGGHVCRIAHHRSYGGDGPQGYWAEPHAVPSPSGTRVLFGSDWGGGASVDAYVVELPGYR